MLRTTAFAALAFAFAWTSLVALLDLSGHRLVVTWYSNGVTAIAEANTAPVWALGLDGAALVVVIAAGVCLARGKKA